MRTFATIFVCLGAAVLLPATTARGGVHIIPLPELTGIYRFESLWGFDGPETKQVSVQTALPWNDVTKVTFGFSGTADYGLVRGDGYGIAATDEAILNDGYYLRLVIGNCHYNPTHGPLVGTDPAEITVTAPFDGSTGGWLPYPIPADPTFFFADLEFILSPAESFNYGFPGYPLPFTYTPVQPIIWGDSLVLVEPVSVNITDAYLIVEGPTLPEPATLSLLALGGLLALRRRARH